MARYHVRLRVFDTIDLEVDAPDGCLEQEVIDRARDDAAVFAKAREWRVDEERSRVQVLE